MKNLSLIIILGSAIIGLSILLGMAHMDALEYKEFAINAEKRADSRQVIINDLIDEYDLRSAGTGLYKIPGVPQGCVLQLEKGLGGK